MALISFAKTLINRNFYKKERNVSQHSQYKSTAFFYKWCFKHQRQPVVRIRKKALRIWLSSKFGSDLNPKQPNVRQEGMKFG